MAENTLQSKFASAAVSALLEDPLAVTGSITPMLTGEGSGEAVSQPLRQVLKLFAYKAFAQISMANAKAACVKAKSHVTSSGFLSVRAFNVPRQDALMARVQGNVGAFWYAYGAIFGLVAFYNVFTSPLLLLGMFVVMSVYLFLFKINAGKVVKFGEHTCDTSQKTIFFGVLSLLVFVVSGFLSHLLSVTLWGSSLVLLHAAFHKPVVEGDPTLVEDASSPAGVSALEGGTNMGL